MYNFFVIWAYSTIVKIIVAIWQESFPNKLQVPQVLPGKIKFINILQLKVNLSSRLRKFYLDL